MGHLQFTNRVPLCTLAPMLAQLLRMLHHQYAHTNMHTMCTHQYNIQRSTCPHIHAPPPSINMYNSDNTQSLHSHTMLSHLAAGLTLPLSSLDGSSARRPQAPNLAPTSLVHKVGCVLGPSICYVQSSTLPCSHVVLSAPWVEREGHAKMRSQAILSSSKNMAART